MKAIMLMFDSLNRRMLSPYGCTWTKTPNFKRLAKKAVTFDNCYVGSMPCMPARRELHTGRYNFLHRSWGPLEPFDDSVPQILNENGIHSHLSTDHYHYFEDGGATYHTRYSTWECFRGQEGDAWKGLASTGEEHWNHNFRTQDQLNRLYMLTEDEQPQTKTVQAGLDFIRDNAERDSWFLQIECFDPHEPFFTQQKYRDLYQKTYVGDDWPEYRGLDRDDTAGRVRHIRLAYAALLSMCDANLGRVLDLMDHYQLWDDTMLIVNTDHGFLLGEHGFWAKCHCPFYDEVAHTPLFLWDPRVLEDPRGSRETRKRSAVRHAARAVKSKGGRHLKSLVQTVDIAATLLDYFGLPFPKDMQGKSLKEVLLQDTPIRKGALFGIHGGQVNCTDGRYVYMRAPVAENTPLYQYTLMPTRHGGRRAFIDASELSTMELHPPFSFTKGLKTLRLTSACEYPQARFQTVLYDLMSDPGQTTPLCDPETEERMKGLMISLMEENDCPPEQFVRLGLKEGA